MTDPQYPAQPPVPPQQPPAPPIPPQPPYPAAQQPYPAAHQPYPPAPQPYPPVQQPYPAAPPAYPPQQQPYGAPSAQQPYAQQQPYGAAPGYPYGAYPARPATGTVAWAMGFLWFIPYLGVLAGPIVMAALYPSTRRHGGVAAENGRGAANWGLTVLAAVVVSVLLAIIGGVAGEGVRWMLVIAGILFLVVAITHIVTTIVGTVKASGGKPFVPAYAIPFFRR